jgi:hypothetical protein
MTKTTATIISAHIDPNTSSFLRIVISLRREARTPRSVSVALRRGQRRSTHASSNHFVATGLVARGAGTLQRYPVNMGTGGVSQSALGSAPK